ncbi:MAG: sugar transferase [Clostridia bacterium]|jgi:exopolysaccharide biosynthesis polyprenyl glycosylphosphotransferase
MDMCQAKKESTAYYYCKRLMDIVGAIIGIILFSPLFILIPILIKLDSKGSVFFIQTRCGKEGRPFKIIKFRSMVMDAEKSLNDLEHLNEADGPVFKIREDPRRTRFGKFLRRTSLDELPQLLNVLKGDMSLVGPRPPLPAEVARYTPYQRQRLSVKGGLTCYWQICGRSNLSFDEWVELDLKYIRERNLWVDIKIILKTLPLIFTSRGAY